MQFLTFLLNFQLELRLNIISVSSVQAYQLEIYVTNKVILPQESTTHQGPYLVVAIL